MCMAMPTLLHTHNPDDITREIRQCPVDFGILSLIELLILDSLSKVEQLHHQWTTRVDGDGFLAMSQREAVPTGPS